MDSITDDSIAGLADDVQPRSSDKNGSPSSPSPAQWRARIAKCRRFKRNLVEDWRANIDFRRGKVFDQDSDDDRIAVAFDWSATKAKHAGLFSQLPQVRLRAKTDKFRPGVPVFQKKLNSILEQAQVGTAMDECLPDCINAAGFGLAMVAYESRVTEKAMPTAPPVPSPPAAAAPADQAQPPAPPQNGAPDESEQPGGAEPSGRSEPVPYTTAKRFIVDRLSPSDGLWDLSFAGSNFNRSPWVGRTGRYQWARAKKEFDLKDEDKSRVCGTGTRSYYDKLTNTEDQEMLSSDTEIVTFDEVFYWRYLFHDDETSFEAIQRIVFVHGLNEPAMNEPWKGQKRIDADGNEAEDGEIILGSCKPPIQFLTLTYLTDEAIPPSDSAMGRPQVEEMMAARTDMMLQRRYSRPMRWFNNNLVAPEMVTALMRGTWQGMIPINGPGDRVLGEVARANFPRETYESDHVFKSDLMETWNIGGAQGNPGGGNVQIRTAAEANNAQGNMQSRVGYERARVVRFFCNIAEVMAGLVALYGDWSEEEQTALQGLELQRLPGYYTYTVRADASVLLSAQDRYQKLESFWNMTAKSGLVDELPILQEMASLLDIDETVVKQPQPKGVDPANVSLRVDADSLQNPIVVAMLIKTGQMPSPDELEAAKKLIMASTALPQPVSVPGMPSGAVPAGPGGPQSPAAAAAGPGGAGPAPASGGAAPATPTQPAHPDLNMADKVNKRVENGR